MNHLVIFSILCVCVVCVVGDSCGPVSFSSSLCDPVIGTYPGKEVYGGVYLPAINGVLNDAIVNYTTAGPILAPDCWMLAQRFVCGY